MTDAARPGFRLSPSFGMAVLGFVSGLPYVVFTGTVVAWLTTNGINAKAVGVYSMAALPYVFKFLWSPLVTAGAAPFIGRLATFGRLRSWILLCLAIIAPAMLLLPVLNPATSLGLIAGLSLLAILASATQDIAIAGWRIGIARDAAQLNALTSIEQFTYRASAFFGAALALVLAQNVGWTITWWLIAGLFVVCFLCVLFVPDPPAEAGAASNPVISLGGGLRPSTRRALLIPVLIAWGASLSIVFGFMIYILAVRPDASTREFTMFGTPAIALACVLTPIVMAMRALAGAPQIATEAPAVGIWDRLFVNLLEPFIDLVVRLRAGLISFFFLVLFFRFADVSWGALAYPFYLGAPETGGLGHSLVEVSAASKVFGVLMTAVGVAIGGMMLATLKQLPSLVIAGALAAATNLLYADLAMGGVRIDAFIGLIHLDATFPLMNMLVNALSPDGDVSVGNALGRLMVVIAAENLAVGIASVVYVAYLSATVNRRYAAVQFAILASMTMLIAVLFRPMLGELAETRGYPYVFTLTAILGLLGVAAALSEWVRTRGRVG